MNVIERALAGINEQEAAEWGEPIPLASKPDLPTFPAHVLPTWLADYVVGVSEETQTPLDMAGVFALVALSVALNRKAEIYPSAARRYSEGVNLYAVVVGGPGERKSQVIKQMALPIYEYERDAITAAIPAHNQAQKEEQLLLKRKERLLNEAAKGDPAATLELNEVVDAIANYKPIVLPRYVEDDTTSEKLETRLHEQGGRIAVLSAEPGVFDVMKGRYSNGAANIEVYLKGHKGDRLVVSRMSRPDIIVDNPRLTMGLMLQPGVLNGLTRDRNFRDKGMTARFLYSLPPSKVGYQAHAPTPMRLSVVGKYVTNIKALMAMTTPTNSYGSSQPHRIVFTEEAWQLHGKLHDVIQVNMRPDGALRHMADWGAKLLGNVVAIAGLLHVADCMSVVGDIEAPTLSRAWEIGKYFIKHSVAAFSAMGQDDGVEAAEIVRGWVVRNGATNFTKRDAFRSLEKTAIFKQASSLDAPLALLEAHGYIRQVAQTTRGPGRPSEQWEVSPRVIGRKQYLTGPVRDLVLDID